MSPVEAGSPTHYETLGVAPDAEQGQIKAAYRAIVKVTHPDLVPPTEATTARLLAAQAAYDVLSSPADRAAYDEALLHPEPEPEPEVDPDTLDDEWGERAAWEEPEEPAAPIPTPPPPPSMGPPNLGPRPGPTPTPDGSRPRQVSWPPPQPSKVRLRYPGQAARPAVLLLLGTTMLLLALAVSRPEGPALLATTGARCLAVGVGLLAGAAYVVLGKVRETVLAGWLLVLAAVALVEALGPPGALSALRVVPAALAGIVGTAQIIAALRRQRDADQVVRKSSLRTHNMFGALPGGVAPDLLDRDLRPLLDLLAARMMRCSVTDQPFSHMVCCGDRVAYLGALLAPAGDYRWSGPSLLAVTPGQQFPVEVLRCDYPQVLARQQRALGAKTKVQGWIVVYPTSNGTLSAERMGGHPLITVPAEALAQVKDYLTTDNDLSLVDQGRFVKAGEALYGP